MFSKLIDDINNMTISDTGADSSQTHAHEAASSATPNDAASSNATPPASVEGQQPRQSLQDRIQQRKNEVYNWPHINKLIKLAIYSACQNPGCSCTGWKRIMMDDGIPPEDQPVANLTDPCRTCNHVVGAHIEHLQGLSITDINKLLSAVVDVENLFVYMCREEDFDTRQVYLYLFRFLRKCILGECQPKIVGPLGQPPFERPSIAKAVTNFVLYKFTTLPQREWQIMYDLAKMFLYYLNHWQFETPRTIRLTTSNPEERSTYQTNYNRWLVFCHVPTICPTLPHYESTVVFGRTLLRAVYQTVYRRILEDCRLERNRNIPEKGATSICSVIYDYGDRVYILSEIYAKISQQLQSVSTA